MGATQQVLLSMGAAGLPPGFYSDDFSGASPDLTYWVNGPGGHNTFSQTGGTALASGNSTIGVVRPTATTTFGPNQSASITISAGSLDSFGPMIRAQWTAINDVGDGYYIFVNGDASTAGVWKFYANGSFQQITPTLTIGALAGGNVLTLRASGQGTVSLEVFVGAVSKGVVTDDGSGPSGAAYDVGQPGFLMNGANFIAAFSGQEP